MPPATLKVFVAGVASSMAQPFLRLLQNDRTCEKVVGIDLKPPSKPISKLTFHKADIRDSRIEGLMHGCNVLVDLAFAIKEIRDMREVHDVNINGSINVFECAARAGVRRIVYISSLAAYGVHKDNPVPLTEDCPLRGNDRDEFYYSWAKRENELYLDAFCLRNPGIVVTRLRPGWVMGAQANELYDCVVRLPLLPVFIGKDYPLPFIHEEDMARMIHMAASRDIPGGFNAVSDTLLTFREMARILGKRTFPVPLGLARWGSAFLFNAGLTWIPSARQSLKLFGCSFVASNRKAKDVMGWEPNHSIQDALHGLTLARAGGKVADTKEVEADGWVPRTVPRTTTSPGRGDPPSAEGWG